MKLVEKAFKKNVTLHFFNILSFDFNNRYGKILINFSSTRYISTITKRRENHLNFAVNN